MERLRQDLELLTLQNAKEKNISIDPYTATGMLYEIEKLISNKYPIFYDPDSYQIYDFKGFYIGNLKTILNYLNDIIY